MLTVVVTAVFVAVVIVAEVFVTVSGISVFVVVIAVDAPEAVAVTAVCAFVTIPDLESVIDGREMVVDAMIGVPIVCLVVALFVIPLFVTVFIVSLVVIAVDFVVTVSYPLVTDVVLVLFPRQLLRLLFFPIGGVFAPFIILSLGPTHLKRFIRL